MDKCPFTLREKSDELELVVDINLDMVQFITNYLIFKQKNT